MNVGKEERGTWSGDMITLYKSTSVKVHLVQGGYICIRAIGKVTETFRGTRDDITCKNCLEKLN